MAEPMFAVPEKFARQMAEHYGAEGVAWVDRLPLILAECAQRWSLTLDTPFESLSYHYVAPATCGDDTRAVLKVGVPCQEPMTEMDALRLFDGCGSVRLLAFNRGQRALLLERLEPGTPLGRASTFDGGPDDEEATGIAAQVMGQLWRPVPPEHPFPSLADWAAGLGELRARFDGATGPYPATLVEEAEGLVTELLDSTAEPMLLHGDLHPWNILSARRQPWLAVDPKGVVGEPAYETSPLLCIGAHRGPQTGQVLARRVDQLAEVLKLDRARIHGWAVVQALLLAWWVGEDQVRCKQMIARAELLAGIKV
jgi:streptomycin 6-kinase